MSIGTTETTTENAPEAPVSERESVLGELANRLSSSAPEVKSRLTDLMVERELNRRVELLDKALTKRLDLEKAVKKISPDQESFDEKGVVVSTTFSKKRHEERKKASEALGKHDKAIELALSGDFSKLKDDQGKENKGKEGKENKGENTEESEA